ncbi:ribose ABC transporter permease [Halobacteriales archaeon QS_1_69_70]|nr:MAG: ribose ABC transporter permease [Halobacteriales archaeon QS_1_69_70]
MSVRDRARRALQRLVEASATERALISLASLAASILVGAGIVLVAGRTATCEEAAFVLATPRPFGVPELASAGFCYDPVAVFDRLFLGALGDPASPGWDPLNGRMATTLRETAVLVFTGLSVALAFRAGVFNIGTQGQLVVGALATAVAVLWAATFVAGVVGTVVLVPFGVLVGAAFGGLYGAIPGALKAYADANEVVTTIMLNFIASGVALYLVRSVFKDPASPANQTIPLPDHALFPPLLFAPQFGVSILALLFGLLAAGGVFVLLRRTVFGYDLRASGLQPAAAEYGGVDARRTVVASMTLSGALGGIGGAVYVLMVLGKFQTDVPAYGFDGITVAILAGNNPLGVALAAFLFGVLKSGTTVVQFATDVPPQLVGVLRGLIILFVAMPEFFRLLGRRVLPRNRAGGDAVAADGGSEPDGTDSRRGEEP